MTEHFSLEELSRSDTAMRLGIDNEPPPDKLINLATLALGLEGVRSKLHHQPINVLSGYRCEALERVLCQKDYMAWCSRHGKHASPSVWAEYFKRKAHPKGFAADFIAPKFGPPERIVEVLAGSGLKFDQLICEGTWIHVSFDPMMRGDVMKATFYAGTPRYDWIERT